jgi:hypothetical protein
MSEALPVVFDFVIDKNVTDPIANLKVISLPVTVHSYAHNKRL